MSALTVALALAPQVLQIEFSGVRVDVAKLAAKVEGLRLVDVAASVVQCLCGQGPEDTCGWPLSVMRVVDWSPVVAGVLVVAASWVVVDSWSVHFRVGVGPAAGTQVGVGAVMTGTAACAWLFAAYWVSLSVLAPALYRPGSLSFMALGVVVGTTVVVAVWLFAVPLHVRDRVATRGSFMV